MEIGESKIDMMKMIDFHPTIKFDLLPSRLEIASRIMAGMLSAIYSNKEMLNEFLTDSSKGYLQHVTGQKAFTENALGYADALIKAYKGSGGEAPK